MKPTNTLKALACALLLAVALLSPLAAITADADPTDLWDVYQSGTGSTVLWRVDRYGNLSGANATITNLTPTIGNMTVVGQRKLTPTTVTANATLTVNNSSLIFIGTINGDRTYTLPSAVTAGAGAVIDWVDTGGNISVNGNVTWAATAGSVLGATSINNTTYEQGRIISNGSNWYSTVTGKSQVH